MLYPEATPAADVGGLYLKGGGGVGEKRKGRHFNLLLSTITLFALFGHDVLQKRLVAGIHGDAGGDAE